jgi:hypothetical protein
MEGEEGVSEKLLAVCSAGADDEVSEASVMKGGCNGEEKFKMLLLCTGDAVSCHLSAFGNFSATFRRS